MLLAKLGMGVSEALIGVWATVWVQANAPKDSQARWLGFASISAGTGNGAGSAVAGFCSKSLGYSFAFVLQAAVLFLLWGVMLLSPSRFFEFESAAARQEATPKPNHPVMLHTANSPEHAASDSDADLEARRQMFRRRRSTSGDMRLTLREEIAHNMSHLARQKSWRLESIESFSVDASPRKLSMWATFKIVMGSSLWLSTAFAISLSCFITSAVAYMWQNTTSNVWHFNNNEATASFLVTTGVGGMVGVALGPKLFDEYLGGFQSRTGIHQCLKWCITLSVAAVVLGTISAALFLDTAWHLVHYEEEHQARGFLMMCVLLGIFCVFALVNAMQGTLYGINTDSTTPDTKTSAAALTVSMQNVIGFALGPLLPSVVAEMVGDSISAWTPKTDTDVVHSAEFAAGMAVSLLFLWPLLYVLKHAASASSVPELPTEPSLPGHSSSQTLLGSDSFHFIRSDGPALSFDPL